MKPYYSDYVSYVTRRHFTGRGREDSREAVAASLEDFSLEERELIGYVYKTSTRTDEGVKTACKVFHIYSEGRVWKLIKNFERNLAMKLELIDE